MWSSGNNNHKSAKLSFFILKAFGVACYSIEGNNVISTLFDKILFSATVSLWVTLIWVQISKQITFDKNVDGKIFFINSLSMYSYIIQHFFGLTVVVHSFIHRPRIEKILKIFRNFDQKLFRFGWKSESQERFFKKANFVFLAFTIMVAVYISANVINSVLNHQKIDRTVLLIDLNDGFMMLFNVAVSGQFIASASSIRCQLENMNINLR